METTGNINKILTCSFEWDIRNFFSLSRELNSCYNSPDFEFGNATWHLRIYPNGNIEDRQMTDWISLGLSRRKSQSEKYAVTCKLCLIDKNGLDYMPQSFKHEIVNGVNWGYLKFLKRSQLLQDRVKVAPNDTLTVSCTLSCKECDIKAKQKTVFSKNISAVPEDNAPSRISWNTFINEQILTSLDEEDDMDYSIGDEDTDSDEEDESEDEDDRNYRVKGLKTNGGDKVLQDLKNLLLSEEDSDVTLTVKDKLFRAHKLILRARSSVFYSMFKHDTVERNSNIVNITDCEPDAFQDFLLCLYSGKVEKMTESNVFGLYTIADKYDLQEVKMECIEFMDKGLSVGTFCDVIALALRHKELALIESATSFFVKNVKEVVLTTQWQTFLKENSFAANELYTKALDQFEHK